MLTGKEMADVGKKPGKRTKELMEKQQKLISGAINHTYPFFIDEAKGAVVKDIDGNIYIDFYGGVGVLNAGHCPDQVVEAVKEQAEKYMHTFFGAIMYEPYIALAERLVSITPGSFEKKAAFINSGAEAVENAIKFAKSYTKRTGIVAFEPAFHGRTLLAMTLTSKVRPYKFGFGPFAPEVYKVSSAYCYRCPYKSTYPVCGLHCLERFKRFFKAEADPENIAAMIIEPVQGEGGTIVPPPEFLPGLKKICEQNGIVFIADEIQTGFCRTGKMFAVENYHVEPDLITMAKSIASGMPLSAVVGRAKIMDSPGNEQIGGTFMGNPLSCAAGLATIDFYEKEQLWTRAVKIGERAVERLREMQDKYPVIGDIRALGAMIGIEIVNDRKTKEPAPEKTEIILKECFDRGLLILGAGIYSNIMRILMPLVITDEQLEWAINVMDEAFAHHA